MAENKVNWNTVLIVLVIGVVGILLLSNSGILSGAFSKDVTGAWGSGGGTVGSIPIWTGPTSLGRSSLTENGYNLRTSKPLYAGGLSIGTETLGESDKPATMFIRPSSDAAVPSLRIRSGWVIKTGLDFTGASGDLFIGGDGSQDGNIFIKDKANNIKISLDGQSGSLTLSSLITGTGSHVCVYSSGKLYRCA